ncbi:MAG TPA: hypothetical protein P5232_02350 [Candidatus Moranbacteria bacterium]|nr:hypothetical protein [Candidatus Moranbacteria bacterium]
MINNIQLLDQYNQLREISQEAIDHIDSGVAERVLREIRKNFPVLNLGKATSDLDKKIYDLQIKMQIVNFLAITNEEAMNIFKNHLLSFFRIDIPMEERVISRYNYVGYSEKESARLALKKAILENKERLGNLTIGEWVNKFEEKDVALGRSENSIMTFMSEDLDAKKLPKTEHGLLKIILHVYKKLIALKLIDIFDIAETLKESAGNKQPDKRQSYLRYISPETELSENAKTANLTLPDALKSYPDLGEQLITSNYIKLKNFPEPVRPSIKNWLSDYTFNTGYESHGAMDRGTYLFRNENAKILNSADRERLSYVLKSYDENSLIDVNTNTKQIVFPKAELTKQHASSIKTEYKPAPIAERKNTSDFGAQNQASRNFQEIYNAPKQNVQPKNEPLSFSSPQKLPYEKQTALTKNYSPQPMRISSQNSKQNENNNSKNNRNVPPGNIVNLKE